MRKTAWKLFPYPEKAYQQAGAALKKHWPRLHAGDCEPFPAAAGVQEAWRAYHAGDFARAVEEGLALGLPGYHPANKAAMIYATYLEDDADRQLELFLEVAQRCEELQAAEPGNANAWYYHAYALGRYSQGISVAKALAKGTGGKVRTSLELALKLEPNHADAHIALGTWHAEIVDKVGSLMANLTYGARSEAAERHFATALELNPDSAIARMEYAKGMVMLFGRSRLKEAKALYAEAAAMTAADAMERLDIEAAKDEVAGD